MKITYKDYGRFILNEKGDIIGAEIVKYRYKIIKRLIISILFIPILILSFIQLVFFLFRWIIIGSEFGIVALEKYYIDK